MPIPSSKGFRPYFFVVFLTSVLFAIVSVHLSGTVSQASPEKVYASYPVSPFVKASGRELYLNGEKYQFTGVNAYNLGTYPGANAGCGSYVDNVDTFFSKLRPNSVIRMWAFQGATSTNVTTKQTDWTGLDRIVNAAERNGMKLILVLGEQSGHCDDGHYKDIAWYSGGYKEVTNDYGNGLTPLPYFDYVKQVVSRYKNSPSIAMWEPMNEPAAGTCKTGKGYECYADLACPDEQAAAKAMRSFFDEVGGTIKSIDPNHLISSGTIGDGQCGTVYEDYKYVHESPGIDVGSFHDYQRDDQPIPGDEWNGMRKRIEQMTLVNKPLITGEVGMLAKDNDAGCISYDTRKNKMKAKLDAQFAAGVAGFIPWSYTNGNSGSCNYDIVQNDPLLTLIRDYPASMSTTVPTSSITPFPTPTPKPIDTQPPTAPTSLTASLLSTTQVSLKWNAGTDNVGVVRYDLFRNGAYLTSTADTSFTNSNLIPSTTYVYHVKSRDAANNISGESNKVSVVTTFITPTPTPTIQPTQPPPPDTQSPTAPTNLRTSNLTANQVTLSWNASTDNVGISRYDLFRNGQYLTSTGATTFTNTNLSPATLYTYHVKGKDFAGNNSAESNKVTITTLSLVATPTPTSTPSPTPTKAPDTQPPSAPTNVKAVSVSPTQILVSWSPATDNVGVVRYEISRDYVYFTATTGTSQLNSNLKTGQRYLYYVKARDAAGNSSVSSAKVTATPQ